MDIKSLTFAILDQITSSYYYKEHTAYVLALADAVIEVYFDYLESSLESESEDD